MSDTLNPIILPNGLNIDRAVVAAHVMQPLHVRGVLSSKGMEEGEKLVPRKRPPGALTFNTDEFVSGLNAALADNTAGYVMQLRQHGKPIASTQVNWAKRPSDGSESWSPNVRMHIASCSKLITAIAMTKTLASHNLPPSTKIIDYLPNYWIKGPNIDKITFSELMTHSSGFRITGSDMSFPTMKALIAGGVKADDIGRYSYQNTNFSICRILLPVMNSVIPAGAVFPPPFEDSAWDFVTINA